MPPGPSDPLPLYAVVAPGLEGVAAGELAALGARPVVEHGGIAFAGDARLLCAANLRLRTASRVLLRLAEFPARALGELERRARQVPWERVVTPGVAVRFRVTSRKSRLYHTGAVAQRLGEALLRRVPGAVLAEGGGDPEEDDGGDAQLIVVRVAHDRVLVSADSSGAHLHRRGYRLEVAKAPLRETLAAGILLASGWPGDVPLLDPMCGSGTIAIEGALIARRIAPGLLRARFAAEAWPELEREPWEEARAAARAEVRPAASAPIVASDRDAGAVEAAAGNAERAGVHADIELSRRPLSAMTPPAGEGWLVTNPPYGARLGDPAALRDLHARLGQLARERCPGWTVAVLAADPRLAGQLRLPLTERLRASNGGIPVRLLVGRVPTAATEAS